jgi:sulfur carrier protein
MVTVEVVGEETREIDPGTLGTDPTYADLVRAVDYSPHEVSVLVDDQPVPEDRRSDADHVRVLRLIKGG